MTDDDDREKQTAAARGRVKRPVAVARPAPPAKPRGLRIHRADPSARGAGAVDVALDDERRLVVGRHGAADVAFEAPEVSRIHGALSCENDRWLYQDLGSSNGSALVRRGERVALLALDKTALEPADVVVIGNNDDARLELLADAPAAPTAAVATSTALRSSSEGPAQASAASRALDDSIGVAAKTPLPVFLLGVSGAGKTHCARTIHDRQHDRGSASGAFVAVNCARLPTDATSLQSELLGHVKGAFTGAVADRVGKLFAADGGTLFLDEVESLPALAQGFLLDVLEGHGHTPLGGRARAESQEAPAKFRLISASKRPLAQSGLRADLCERLAAGHMITLPSLEDRRADMPALIRAFAEEQARLLGVDVDVTPDGMRALCDASWPGQLRQLRAAVVTCAHVALARVAEGQKVVVIRRDDVAKHIEERATAFADEASAGGGGGGGGGAFGAVKPNPRHLTAVDVKRALERHDGNQSAAARELGIARNTLLRKMKDFGIGGAE